MTQGRSPSFTLSRRGQRLLDSPPMPSYIDEHFARVGQLWDPDDRPDGYVPLCIAENKRKAGDLMARLSRYGDVPSSVLGYDAMVGTLEFRENLAAFLSRSFLGRTVTSENLAVLAGAGSVLELLFYVIADQDDGVLVPTPSYAGFWADLGTRDRLSIIRVDTTSEEGFALTPARLEAALEGAAGPVRALLFTNPDNPLGRVASADEVAAIRSWTEQRGIHLVLDEIYALSVFGPRAFVSGASLGPLGDLVHVVWAFSKDFGASGLRCGVLVSENEAVLKGVSQLAYWAVCSGHTQHLLSRLVADTASVDRYLREVRQDLAETYGAVTKALNDARIPFVPAEAAFFLLCDLRSFLDEPTFEGEARLWRKLLEDANVNLTPGEACRIAEPGFFRLCYGGVEAEAVQVGIDRLGRCLAS